MTLRPDGIVGESVSTVTTGVDVGVVDGVPPEGVLGEGDGVGAGVGVGVGVGFGEGTGGGGGDPVPVPVEDGGVTTGVVVARRLSLMLHPSTPPS